MMLGGLSMHADIKIMVHFHPSSPDVLIYCKMCIEEETMNVSGENELMKNIRSLLMNSI